MTYPPPPGSGDYVPPSSDPAAPPVYPPPSYAPPQQSDPAYPPPGYGPPQQSDPAYPPPGYGPPQQSDPYQNPGYAAPGYPQQPDPYQAPGYAAPGQPQQPDPAYPGYQPPADQSYPNPAYQYGYANPYGYSPYPVKPPPDGLAIASLVVSCVAVLGLCGYGVGGLIGIVGAVLGHVSRRRIKTTGAGGEGMALAGIIVGWIAAGIGLLVIIGIVVAIAVSGDFSSN